MVLLLPMIPLATNGPIGKIANGTIWRIPNVCRQPMVPLVPMLPFVRTLNDIGIPWMPLVEP